MLTLLGIQFRSLVYCLFFLLHPQHKVLRAKHSRAPSSNTSETVPHGLTIHELSRS